MKVSTNGYCTQRDGLSLQEALDLGKGEGAGTVPRVGKPQGTRGLGLCGMVLCSHRNMEIA